MIASIASSNVSGASDIGFSRSRASGFGLVVSLMTLQTMFPLRAMAPITAVFSLRLRSYRLRGLPPM